MSAERDTGDGQLAPPFGPEAVEVTGRESLFRGFFSMVRLRLRHQLFRGGWSDAFERELFVRGDAVAALLYDPRHRLVGLIEQFRVGALERPGGPWCHEVVAGIVEPGESCEEVARREVREEAGLDVGELEYICSYYPSPGGCSERIHLYAAAADLDGAGGVFGLEHENEDIRLRVVALEDALATLASARPGQVQPLDNAATIIALQWLQLHASRLFPPAAGTEAG